MKLKSFKTLNENWNKWVNESPEDDERGQLIDAIREYSKDLTGSRDDYGSFEKLEAMSLEQLQDYLKGMANSPEAQEREDRFRDEEEAAMGADSDFDRMPKQQGMGRPMEEGEGAMDSSEIISYLDGMIDDLNSEVVSFQNFDADVNNRGRSSAEEVAFERGAAEAKKEAIEKLDAILNMIKAGSEKGVQNEASSLEERIKKAVTRKLQEKAKSKNQQQFMGMVKKCQETGDCASTEVKKAADSMKKGDVDDFARTKHKGLPDTVEDKK